MNRIQGIIQKVDSSRNLSVLSVSCNGDALTVILVETPETNSKLKPENSIFLLFKETELGLGKNVQGKLSFQNRMKSIVTNIEPGSLFTRVELDYRGSELVSILPNQEIEKLSLIPGDQVEGLIQASEISILS